MRWCNGGEEDADADGKVGLLLIESSNDKVVVAGSGFSKVVLVVVVVVEEDNDRRPPNSNWCSDEGCGRCCRLSGLFTELTVRAGMPLNDDGTIDDPPVALFERAILLWQKRRLLFLLETAVHGVLIIRVGVTNSTSQ